MRRVISRRKFLFTDGGLFMSKLLISLLVFASSSAMAMPLITCNNPATGASIVVSTYSDSLNYNMNQTLMSALDSQRGHSIDAQGMGGVFQGGDSYVLQLSQTDFLSLAPYPGTSNYMLSVFRADAGSENFTFNPGECVVAR
jgi:hypothetical protein